MNAITVQQFIVDVDPAPSAHPEAAGQGSLREWVSRDLLGARSVALIHHEGEVYRLQRTRQNKLLLTK